MDYKYIEQLLESYFEAKTSLEEEQILRAFFAQQEIPAHLQDYVEFFREQSFGKNEESIGKDFVTFKPLWRAAACVAVVLALGQAAQMPYTDKEQEQQEQMARTLEMLQKVQQDQNTVAQNDSIVNQNKTVN